MKKTTKDIHVLRIAILPAFILTSVIGAIAVLSVSISNAVVAGASTVQEQITADNNSVKDNQVAAYSRERKRIPPNY